MSRVGRNVETSGAHVMQRARVEYADHNESFASYLPRSGALTRRLHDIHGNSDWFLLQLDDPLEYQLKVGEPYRFRLVQVSHFLLRSRWKGQQVGDADPTAVFILLVGEDQREVPDPLDPSSYVHVAWGMCSVEA